MVVVGVYLKGSTARIVTLAGTRKKHSREKSEFHKLDLPRPVTPEGTQNFVKALQSHIQETGATVVVINKRQERGTHASGSATFHMEGALFASLSSSCLLVAPATMTATKRKFGKLKVNSPPTKDLGAAYDLAFEGLIES